MTAQPLFQFAAVSLYPTPDRRVIRLQTALGEQLLDIAQRQRVPEIPAHGTKNQLRRRLPPLEDCRSGCVLHGLLSLPSSPAKVATHPSRGSGSPSRITVSVSSSPSRSDAAAPGCWCSRRRARLSSSRRARRGSRVASSWWLCPSFHEFVPTVIRLFPKVRKLVGLRWYRQRCLRAGEELKVSGRQVLSSAADRQSPGLARPSGVSYAARYQARPATVLGPRVLYDFMTCWNRSMLSTFNPQIALLFPHHPRTWRPNKNLIIDATHLVLIHAFEYRPCYPHRITVRAPEKFFCYSA
jgi:hypothetical protein